MGGRLRCEESFLVCEISQRAMLCFADHGASGGSASESKWGGLPKVGGDDADEVGDGDFGFSDVGVPELFPLKTEISLVVDGGESLHLPLNGDVAFAG